MQVCLCVWTQQTVLTAPVLSHASADEKPHAFPLVTQMHGILAKCT